MAIDFLTRRRCRCEWWHLVRSDSDLGECPSVNSSKSFAQGNGRWFSLENGS